MIGERFSHQIVYVKFWVNVDPCFLNDSEIIPHSESYLFSFCARARKEELEQRRLRNKEFFREHD
jgi:hypothetical protein